MSKYSLYDALKVFNDAFADAYDEIIGKDVDDEATATVKPSNYNKNFTKTLTDNSVNKILGEYSNNRTCTTDKCCCEDVCCEECNCEEHSSCHCVNGNVMGSFATSEINDESILPSEYVDTKTVNTAYGWAEEYVNDVIREAFGDRVTDQYAEELEATLAEFMCWVYTNKLANI